MYCTFFGSIKNVMPEEKFRDMYGHQPRIPAQQVYRDTHGQRHNPGQPGVFAQDPLQKREQQI